MKHEIRILLLGLSCALCAGSYQGISAKEEQKKLPTKENAALSNFKNTLNIIQTGAKLLGKQAKDGRDRRCENPTMLTEKDRKDAFCMGYTIGVGITDLAYTVSNSTLTLIEMIQSGRFEKLQPYGPCLKMSDEELRECFTKISEKKEAKKPATGAAPAKDTKTDLCTICPAAGCISSKACAASLLKAFADTGLPKLIADLLVGSVIVEKDATGKKTGTTIRLGLLGQGANTLSFTINSIEQLRKNPYLAKLLTLLEKGNKDLDPKKPGVTLFTLVITAVNELVENLDLIALLIGGEDFLEALAAQEMLAKEAKTEVQKFDTKALEATKGQDVKIEADALSAVELENIDTGDWD